MSVIGSWLPRTIGRMSSARTINYLTPRKGVVHHSTGTL